MRKVLPVLLGLALFLGCAATADAQGRHHRGRRHVQRQTRQCQPKEYWHGNWDRGHRNRHQHRFYQATRQHQRAHRWFNRTCTQPRYQHRRYYYTTTPRPVVRPRVICVQPRPTVYLSTPWVTFSVKQKPYCRTYRHGHSHRGYRHHHRGYWRR